MQSHCLRVSNKYGKSILVGLLGNYTKTCSRFAINFRRQWQNLTGAKLLWVSWDSLHFHTSIRIWSPHSSIMWPKCVHPTWWWKIRTQTNKTSHFLVWWMKNWKTKNNLKIYSTLACAFYRLQSDHVEQLLSIGGRYETTTTCINSKHQSIQSILAQHTRPIASGKWCWFRCVRGTCVLGHLKRILCIILYVFDLLIVLDLYVAVQIIPRKRRPHQCITRNWTTRSLRPRNDSICFR